MAATPQSHAIVLTCTLDDFLISNLKKPADSQAKISVLVDRALAATTFMSRLPAAALAPPSPACAAGLQWAAQRELMQDVLEAVGPERIRAIDMRPLLDAPATTVWQCAQWLQVPAPRDVLMSHATDVATRNAKALAVPYSSAQRTHEATLVSEHYDEMLSAARVWLAAHVLPAMRPHARTDPAPWT